MVRREPFHPEHLATLCRRHGVRRLAMFGSALREDFHAGSDIDLPVEFDPAARTGLRMFELEADLTELFGRKVDLSTPGFLGVEFRERVRREAKDLHVAP